jgi:hypothetical protein
MSSDHAINFCSSENEAASISGENGEVTMEEDFETIHIEKQDIVTITNQCAYVQKLLEVSKLHVLQPGRRRERGKEETKIYNTD